ncbi:MAG TPA: MFS transporter [Solirubrobacterales bacterium]|nr:MFS transporter [Solirubrobacterales bacterium]
MSAALPRRTVLALAAMGLAVFLIANDITSLTVALPTIERDFHTDVGTVQWVANAYTLVFGVLIVTGGRLSDIFGRRRMFFAGTALFAGFSVLAALAPSAPVLIGARAAMAVGAALIWPAVVGILFSLLPKEKAGIAGGLLLGVSGVGNACGPLIGGLLTDAASWRWILVLNIPIALASALVVRAEIAPDQPADRRRHLDWTGVALLSLGLVGLLVALDQSSTWGWGDPKTIALLAVGVVALAAFVVTQLRLGERALVPRDVITNRVFGAACLTTLLASGTWFAVLLYGPQFMQKVLGFSALGSGVGFLPLMLVYTAASFAAGPLYNRLGGRALLLVGAACLALGALGLSFLGAGSPYAATLPGFVILGIGVGFFYSTLTNLAITALDPARSSVGGGLLFMFQLVGGAIGVVLTTAVFFGVGGDLAGATSAGELPAAAKQAFAEGLHAGFLVDAALGFLALATALLVVRGRHSRRLDGSDDPVDLRSGDEHATAGTN